MYLENQGLNKTALNNNNKNNNNKYFTSSFLRLIEHAIHGCIEHEKKMLLEKIISFKKDVIKQV